MDLEEKRRKNREAQRRYFEKDPERKRAQGRASARRWRKRHPDRAVLAVTQTQFWIQNHPEAMLIHRSRNNAKRNGLEHTITVEDISIPVYCSVLGLLLKVTGSRDQRPTIDRIDNTKGYVPENIAVISWKANRLKSNATTEELQKLAQWANR